MNRTVLNFNIPEQEPLVAKGRKRDEILPGLKQKLASLKEHADVQVTNLPSSLLHTFLDTQNTVKIMYDTEDFDEIYHSAVKMFKRDELYDAGTVGAYFTGCLCGTDLKHGGACGVTCARSMPPPRSQNHKFCGFNVLWLVPNDKGDHDLRQLSVVDTHKAILHINGDHFPGLSRVEKEALKNKKISEVEIYKYTKNSKKYTYKKLTDGFVKVEDLADRHHAAPEHHKSNYGWLLIAILLLILLVLAFVIFRRPVSSE